MRTCTARSALRVSAAELFAGIFEAKPSGQAVRRPAGTPGTGRAAARVRRGWAHALAERCACTTEEDAANNRCPGETFPAHLIYLSACSEFDSSPGLREALWRF